IGGRRHLQVTRRIELQKVGVSLLIANLKSWHDAVSLTLRDRPGPCVRSMVGSSRSFAEPVRSYRIPEISVGEPGRVWDLVEFTDVLSFLRRSVDIYNVTWDVCCP